MGAGSTCMKYTALLLFIVVLISIGVLIAVLGPNICERKGCINKAKYIQSTINLDINPCTEFYEFVCGNYEKNVEPLDKRQKDFRTKGRITVLSRIEINIKDTIEHFKNDNISVTDDRILKLVKKMYQPCLNIAVIEKQGTKPLWDAIWSIGGVPVVNGDKWNQNNFELGDVEYKTRKAGFLGQRIFQALIAEDEKNPGKFAIYIKPPEFSKDTPGMELVTLKMSEKLLHSYRSFIVRLTFYLISEKLGLTYEEPYNKDINDRFTNELNKTLDLKINLYKHLKAYWAEQDPVNLYNRMTLEKLQSEFSYINWKQFFKRMLPTPEKLPNEIVVVGTSYFKSIKELIEKTDKRTIANYLMIENFIESSLFLPSVYFRIYNKFLFNLKVNKYPRRKDVCLKVVIRSLKAAISSLFVQTYNKTGKGSQKTLEKISQMIKQELKKSIETLKWMDEETKKSAYLKLNQVKFRLSISNEQLAQLSDEEARARYYEDLCLGRRLGHVLPSYFCVNKFHLRRNWELLERTPTAFDMHITDVFGTEFEYNNENNEILVPYGMLKFPIFNDVWPTYLKYGGVGSIIGEVFTHGFDTIGAQHNNLGFKTNWWTGKTKELYQKQVNCFSKEYKNYILYVSNLSVPNVTFRPEFLAHFEGVNLASQAYSKYTERSLLREQSLPGLGQFSPQQLFFIGFANEYCSHYSLRYLNYILQKQENREFVNNFKVKGSLSKSKKFSNAFNCGLGENMNPKQKCNFLW